MFGNEVSKMLLQHSDALGAQHFAHFVLFWQCTFHNCSTLLPKVGTMQAIRPSQVPEYLRTSSFFKGLDITGDDVFSIPINHMKANLNVETIVDMRYLRQFTSGARTFSLNLCLILLHVSRIIFCKQFLNPIALICTFLR